MEEKMIETFLSVVGVTSSTVVQVLAFKMLWLWFVVPVFSVRPISFFEAFGILLIVSFLRMGSTTPQVQGIMDLDFKEAVIVLSIIEIVLSLFVLGVGFLLQLLL